MTALVLTSFAISHPGGRSQNEDSWRRVISPARSALCWIVADGLGGHEGGEEASRLAVESAMKSFQEYPSVTEAEIERHVLSADEAIRRRKAVAPQFSAMLTTLVILVSDGATALWAHVGDSRLYQFRKGRCLLRTRDHSVPQVMATAGDIPESAIRHHEDRSRLLRSLGGPEPARVEVAESPRTLVPGDAFLLCTDGFWEYVLETEMEADLAKSAGPDEWLETMVVDRLLRRAPPQHDNLTAVAVFVRERSG
ncbi:MAG: serine/threonine-protein phosphatase [Candidatus Thiosymbion ectosymbiont of Robbea hypermnestra]|nr:serine/threonine-protein phosphatase [Candidatus Thiosymbion ectosymbiont of Robbea hypermnestra]